eukprot:403353384
MDSQQVTLMIRVLRKLKQQEDGQVDQVFLKLNKNQCNNGHKIQKQAIDFQLYILMEIYHTYGNMKDQDGRYFGSRVMKACGFIYEDEWIQVSSQRIIPISIFEASQGNLDLVKFLTEQIQTQDFQYVDIHLPEVSNDQNNLIFGTPLYNACSSGRLDIARYLLQFPSQINHRTFFDVSSLIIAIQNDHLDIAELLINNGAQISLDSKFVKNQQKINESLEKLNIVHQHRIMKFLYFKQTSNYNFECVLFQSKNKNIFEKIMKEYY